MKDLQETLLGRRSIRRYERESITADQLAIIHQAIRNTPTSYNGQQFSVIDIDDQEVKEQLYGLIGQKQIKTCSHFMVFCADYHKISVISGAKGMSVPEFQSTADGIIVGTVDASLAMMSAIVAAESLGLGTCPIGYARTAAPEATAKLLKLPKGVFIVCGLAIGVPREYPDIKPKQPLELLIHHNGYRTDDIAPGLKAYDEEIQHFNATRTGRKTDNDWAGHILGYYQEAMSYDTLGELRRCGFDARH